MPVVFIDRSDRGFRIPGFGEANHAGWAAFFPQDANGNDIGENGEAVFAPNAAAAMVAARQRWGDQVVGFFRSVGEVCSQCGVIGGH